MIKIKLKSKAKVNFGREYKMFSGTVAHSKRLFESWLITFEKCSSGRVARFSAIVGNAVVFFAIFLIVSR